MEPGESLGGSRKDEMKALESVAGVRGQTRAAGDYRLTTKTYSTRVIAGDCIPGGA